MSKYVFLAAQVFPLLQVLMLVCCAAGKAGAHEALGAGAYVHLQHRTGQQDTAFELSTSLKCPTIESFRHRVASLGAVGVVPRAKYDTADANHD